MFIYTNLHIYKFVYIFVAKYKNRNIMATEKISIKTGIPVEGADFHGRKKELEYAWK